MISKASVLQVSQEELEESIDWHRNIVHLAVQSRLIIKIVGETAKLEIGFLIAPTALTNIDRRFSSWQTSRSLCDGERIACEVLRNQPQDVLRYALPISARSERQHHARRYCCATLRTRRTVGSPTFAGAVGFEERQQTEPSTQRRWTGTEAASRKTPSAFNWRQRKSWRWKFKNTISTFFIAPRLKETAMSPSGR